MYRIYYTINANYRNIDNYAAHHVYQQDYLAAETISELKAMIERFIVEFALKESKNRIVNNYLLDGNSYNIDCLIQSIESEDYVQLDEYLDLTFTTPIMMVVSGEEDYTPLDSEKVINNMINYELKAQKERNRLAVEENARIEVENERRLYEELRKKFES